MDLVCFRLYEMYNERGRTTIDLWKEFSKATSTDLLEEPLAVSRFGDWAERFAFHAATIRSSH